MCGDPPSSPVISSDSEKSFSSAVKRCIYTWGGEGEVCHSANTGCFIPGKRWWYGEGIAPMKIFWKFFKDFSAMTSSVLSIWYPIYRELDRPNSFSKLSTHFDFPRRFSSRFFRETIWQKASPIKKARWKIPCLSSGFFTYSMPKGSFPLPGSLKIPDPHKKSKKSGACFPQLSRNASYNFSMISTSLSFTIHSLYDRTGILLWYAHADKIHFVLLVS